MASSAGWWLMVCLMASSIPLTAAQEQCFLDLCFLVDSSGSINYKDATNWDTVLQFVTNVTNSFTIGPRNVQVAFVLFSATANVEWFLTRYPEKRSLIDAIRRVGYIGSETNLNDALRLTWSEVFAAGRGTRPGAIKAAVILTNGEDNVPREGTTLTLENARRCRDAGIRLMAVGVSNMIDRNRLMQIVTPPSSSNFYVVPDFNSLQRIVLVLTPQICVTPPPPTIRCTLCSIELAFLLDSSTKNNPSAWTQMLNFVSDVVRQYSINSNCVRVAVIRYSNSGDVPFQLSRYSDVNSLQQAIGAIQFLGGASNLAVALDLLRNQVFASNVVRQNTARIAIIVTDQLQRNSQIDNAANSVKSEGITIVAVGITVTGRVDVSYLNSIGSSGCTIQTSDYSRLIAEARDRIVQNQQCGCIRYVAPPPPAPNSASTRQQPPVSATWVFVFALAASVTLDTYHDH